MRKEFKFVRGLYTNKKLFDDDIIEDSFVILDEKSDNVSFDVKDDNTTQSQLINASNNGRVRKVYTITPDKITMNGDLKENGNYKFTPTVKEIIDDETIPGNVKTKAETFLKEHLTADYAALTAGKIGIGENSNPDFVDVIFTDNNAKSFTRQMKFRVEGKVNKSSFVNIESGTVDPTETPVYVLNSNGDRYNIATDVSNTDFFINGRKQMIVDGSYKDSNDSNTYKVAGSPEETNVSKVLVKVELDNKTIISPIHNFSKDGGYIITIDEDKISIKATES